MMLSRDELVDLGAVDELIFVVKQAPQRAAARGLTMWHPHLAGLMLLWSLLRWERTFAIQVLERLAVDIDALAKEIDGLLAEAATRNDDEAGRASARYGDDEMREWLARARTESRELEHDFVGLEHVLLAAMRIPNSYFARLLANHGADHERYAAIVRRAIPPKPSTPSHDADDSPRPGMRESNVVGLPRRFGLAVMLSLTALSAILFAALRYTEASAVVYGVLAVLFVAVAVAQMFLLGGKNPRVASILAGAVVLPIEVLFSFAVAMLVGAEPFGLSALVGCIALTLFSIPVGAFLGYLSGTLTAGAVLILKMLEERGRRSADGDDAEDTGDPFADLDRPQLQTAVEIVEEDDAVDEHHGTEGLHDARHDDESTFKPTRPRGESIP